MRVTRQVTKYKYTYTHTHTLSLSLFLSLSPSLSLSLSLTHTHTHTHTLSNTCKSSIRTSNSLKATEQNNYDSMRGVQVFHRHLLHHSIWNERKVHQHSWCYHLSVLTHAGRLEEFCPQQNKTKNTMSCESLFILYIFFNLDLIACISTLSPHWIPFFFNHHYHLYIHQQFTYQTKSEKKY